MILTLTFIIISFVTSSTAKPAAAFVPLLLSPTRKGVSHSEAMWSLGTIVCKLPDRRFNLYEDDEIEYQSVFFDTIAADCMTPYVIYGINEINHDPDRFGYQRLILIMLKEMHMKYHKRIDFLKLHMHEKYNIKLIFYIETPIDSDTYLEILFKEMWRRQFLNVIVLHRQNDSVRLATYNPFDLSFVHHLSIFEVLKYGIFTDKTTQLLGYPLNVSLFTEDARVERNFFGLTGPDAELSKLVQKKINATFLETNYTTFGELDENGVPAGSLAGLINRSIDISFNLRVYRIEDFKEKVEVTHVSGFSALCFLVPHVSEISKFGNLFKSFDYILWVLITVTLGISTLVWMLLSVLSGEPVMSLTKTLLSLFNAELAGPLLVVPRRLPLRILAMFFVFYGIFISNAFKCNLTSMLMQSSNGTQINKIAQLAYTNYPIYILERYRPILEENMDRNNLTHMKVLRRLQTINDTVYKELIYNNSAVAFVNKKLLTSYYAEERRQRGVPVYHEMRECPVPILQTYAVPLGSPFLGRFDLIIRRAQESGVTQLWESKVRNGGVAKSNNKKATLTSDEDTKQPLGMQHLQACFTLWAIGMCLAMIAFAYEIWTGKVKRAEMQRAQRFEFIN